MTGIGRIARAFESREGLKLMAHAVVGYPDAGTSARILAAMAANGTDLIEAQLPFSDPSADGPSIVAANHAARRAGSRTEACLASLEALRAKTEAPILVMSYLNPILAYGVEALVERAARSGLDGFIVPDYPDDEPELGLAEKCAAAGLALVPLIAPTTSIDRASALAAAGSSPFLYVVLRLGVTGRKTELGNASLERLAALKTRTGKRIAAGFGLRERAQIEALGGFADCAIVGSALVDAARDAISTGADPALAVGSIIRSFQ
ncbi:MAG: tryptophan synthase subunit alpha [Rectinemataceae bacterium]|jgi:tryptophan synthase alpha chain